uniref:Uncharacterized protein n=1 Tax=Myotis myotis TaxID=51298 RepID=A0A7J8AMK5_MYOMY|nr:hypothetical protein mMyoMyo1_008208 [Myotis myotis]
MLVSGGERCWCEKRPRGVPSWWRWGHTSQGSSSQAALVTTRERGHCGRGVTTRQRGPTRERGHCGRGFTTRQRGHYVREGSYEAEGSYEGGVTVGGGSLWERGPTRQRGHCGKGVTVEEGSLWERGSTTRERETLQVKEVTTRQRGQ